MLVILSRFPFTDKSLSDVLSSFGFDDGEVGGEAVTTGRPVDDELEIDDSLSVQDKIVKYLQSDLILHRHIYSLFHALSFLIVDSFYPRLYLVRELAEYGSQLGYTGTVSHLLPLLADIKADAEPVIRQALLEQIPTLALQLQVVWFSFVLSDTLCPIGRERSWGHRHHLDPAPDRCGLGT